MSGLTKDDILRMAREAGFHKWDSTCLSGKSDLDEKLAVGEYAIGEAVFKFATLVAAAEREACAKEISAEINDEIEDEAYCILVTLLARIRARGQV